MMDMEELKRRSDERMEHLRQSTEDRFASWERMWRPKTED
jgi:hypothetical protein